MAEDNIDAFPTQTRARDAARVDEDPAGDQQTYDTYGPLPAAVLWTSKSEGLPHMVSVVDDPRGRRLQCVCKSAAIRGDCWAVAETRRLFGWPEPERT